MSQPMRNGSPEQNRDALKDYQMKWVSGPDDKCCQRRNMQEQIQCSRRKVLFVMHL